LPWRAPSSGSTRGGDGSLILQPSLSHILFSAFFMSFLFVWMIPFFSVLQRCPIPRRPCARPLRAAIRQSTTCRVHHWRHYPHPLHHAQSAALPHPVYRDCTSLFPILPLHNSSRCRGGGTSLSFSRNQGMLRRHGVGGRSCTQYGLLCHRCGGANKEDLDRS
jgi:hypothetical protein